MKLYTINRRDGGVSIMQTDKEPSMEAKRWHPALQAEHDLASIKPITDPQRIPLDRTFRDAWRPDLTVDMARAREVWRERMRIFRMPMLAALDVDYQRADEAQDNPGKKLIAERKQKLRDVTADPAIEAAKTPDALKAVWPDILRG